MGGSEVGGMMVRVGVGVAKGGGGVAVHSRHSTQYC